MFTYIQMLEDKSGRILSFFFKAKTHTHTQQLDFFFFERRYKLYWLNSNMLIDGS